MNAEMAHRLLVYNVGISQLFHFWRQRNAFKRVFNMP